ncbi:MAG: MotA/TolQ/ExbB proton channel family protein [Desulfotomaculales bacterium]
MLIPGSEYLIKTLHAISQSLLIPGILVLLGLLLLTCLQVGSFFGEMRERRHTRPIRMAEVLEEAGKAPPWRLERLERLIEERIPRPDLRASLLGLLRSQDLSFAARKLIAQDILEEEEILVNKRLEKTDLVARLGPLMGLMLTLIPLGPGLAALGQGDVRALAQSIIVAFDATIVGIAAGGTGFLLSRIRRRWYEQQLNVLELLLNVIVEGEIGAGQAEEKGLAGRGSRSPGRAAQSH